ncbi:hypothetical protein EBZ39_00325 [bacterium]|nr:hypothetical protein [bacterium]
MIKTAANVRNEMLQNENYKAAVEKQINYVMRSIETAKSRGYSHACFCVHPSYEREIKNMFLTAGYTFKPTGYVGGVWQLSQDICW